MDILTQHLDYVFYALAGICLMVELWVLGMSGTLLFIALGSLLTGIFISLGFIHQLSVALVIMASTSAASAALLWNTLKRLQNGHTGPETSSDMVGRVLAVTQSVTKLDGRVSFSGVDWLARLDAQSSEQAEVGQQVEVTGVEGTLLLVKPLAMAATQADHTDTPE